MRPSSVLLLPLLLAGCVKSPAVFKIDAGAPWPDGKEGVVYALPRTVFVVQGTATRVERKRAAPGAQCLTRAEAKPETDGALAKKLGYQTIADARKANPDRTTFGIADVKLTTRSEADPAAFYVIEYPRTALADTGLKVTLGPDGVFQSADSSVTDKVLPAATKVVEVAASIVGGALAYGAALGGPPTANEDVCETLAKELDKVNRAREDLYGATVPMQKDTLELLLAKNTVALEAVRGMYFGEAEVTKGPFTCELTPTTSEDTPVFRLHRYSGIEAADGARCVLPEGLSAPAADATPSDAPNTRTMTLDFAAQTNAAIEVAVRATPTDDPGFFYRVPAAVLAGLSGIPKAEVPHSRVWVGQFGVVAALPRAHGGGSAHLAVELHADTGALKSVQWEKKGADVATTVGSIGTATTALLAAEKAREDANDPLLTSQYEQAVLEAEIAIHDAQATIASW